MKKTKKKLLITGGLGFIGSHLARELINSDYSLTLLDNLSPQIHGNVHIINDDLLLSPHISFIKGDILDIRLMENILVNVDVIVHLAAETGTAQSMYQIGHYNNINSQGTAVILNLLAKLKHKVSKIVLASSRAIYGEGSYNCNKCGIVYPTSRLLKSLEASEWNPKCTKCKGNVNPIPTAEDSMPRPSSIYAATKLAQENLVKIACEAIGINSVILRFQNVYGPGQSLNNPYTGILSIFSTRIRRGLNLSLFEDGLESRDFIYISDITKAIRLSIDEDAANNKILNVGTGRPTTIMEISKLLVETLGGEQQPVVTGQYRIGDIRHCYADTTLMSNILKFKTTMSIQTGIKKFCDWVINQPLPKDKLDIANTELKNRGLLG